VIEAGRIEQRILLIRGERVIVDADLAEFYGVPTKRLNEQVRRNIERFPEDFVFQLDADEKSEVVAKCDHLERLKFSKVLPLAFTEHGALMAASVLNSTRAVEVSLFVVRAFVKLRRLIEVHKDFAAKLSQLERKLSEHDDQILSLVRALKRLAEPSKVPARRRIGFDPSES